VYLCESEKAGAGRAIWRSIAYRFLAGPEK
jgi:hypothetical protein